MARMTWLFHGGARALITLGRLHGVGRRAVALGLPACAILFGGAVWPAAVGLASTLAAEVLVARWIYRRRRGATRRVLTGACLAAVGALAAAASLGWPHALWGAPLLLVMSAAMPALPHLESKRWRWAHPAAPGNRPWPSIAASRPDHPTGLSPRPPRWTARPAIRLIRAYREVAPVMPGRRCKHEPSCSRYAEAALARHGLMRGAWLAVGRFLRCSPVGRGGYDPVP